ncbi:transposase [Archangium violaceum]|uniref:transposase n=1 Tax=Archangium violaceum TaxID=83451 RepID=UPI003D283440
MVDGQGLPLAQSLTAADVNDCKEALPLLDGIRPVRSPRGRPRKRPARLHADKAYDHRFIRRGLRLRHIQPRIARRGIDSCQRFGRHRWKAERMAAPHAPTHHPL